MEEAEMEVEGVVVRNLVVVVAAAGEWTLVGWE